MILEYILFVDFATNIFESAALFHCTALYWFSCKLLAWLSFCSRDNYRCLASWWRWKGLHTPICFFVSHHIMLTFNLRSMSFLWRLQNSGFTWSKWTSHSQMFKRFELGCNWHKLERSILIPSTRTSTNWNSSENRYRNFFIVLSFLFPLYLNRLTYSISSFHSDDDSDGQLFHSKYFPTFRWFIQTGFDTEIGQNY